MTKKIAILFSFLYLCVNAQTEEFKEHVSNFNMTSFTYKHDEKWSAYFEAQQRSIQDFTLPDYYELKGGIGYNVAKGNQVFVGVGKYGTYRERSFYQREFRMWLQYTFSHSIDRLKFDHRLRAEKRFFYFPQKDTKSNDERFRYRLSLTLPLNNEKVEPKTIFLNTFDEIFIGPKEPTFKRNRYFAGVGYQLNSFMNTNLGYMWQREFSKTDAKNYHFVYFAVNFTFDRLKHGDSHDIPVAD